MTTKTTSGATSTADPNPLLLEQDAPKRSRFFKSQAPTLPMVSTMANPFSFRNDHQIVRIDFLIVGRGSMSYHLVFPRACPPELNPWMSLQEWQEFQTQINAKAKLVKWNTSRGVCLLVFVVFCCLTLFIVQQENNALRQQEEFRVWISIVLVVALLVAFLLHAMDNCRQANQKRIQLRPIELLCQEYHESSFSQRGFSAHLTEHYLEEGWHVYLVFCRLK